MLHHKLPILFQLWNLCDLETIPSCRTGVPKDIGLCRLEIQHRTKLRISTRIVFSKLNIYKLSSTATHKIWLSSDSPSSTDMRQPDSSDMKSPNSAVCTRLLASTWLRCHRDGENRKRRRLRCCPTNTNYRWKGEWEFLIARWDSPWNYFYAPLLFIEIK